MSIIFQNPLSDHILGAISEGITERKSLKIKVKNTKILYDIDYLCFLRYNQIKLILKLVREEISMSNVQIYVIHHDGENYPTFESENIIPILAGNPVRDGYRISLRDTAGGACITDPEKQDIYSEFTAYYYIWKNMMPKDKRAM